MPQVGGCGADDVGWRKITAPKVIIATGGRPAVPDIAGLDAVPTLDSTQLLDLETLLESLIFLGGAISAWNWRR